MTELAGRGALVTGGLSGIGLGITRALVSAGARVVATYRRSQHLKEAAEVLGNDFGSRVYAIRMDVTDRDEVETAAAESEYLLGKIHLVCNSAGVNLLGPMDEATHEDWEWIIGVNLFGIVNTLKAFLPYVKRHGEGGHIVNVGSMSCFIAGTAAGIYTASKFAVRGLSESLRYSLARHHIAVSLVCPGLTKSRIYEQALYRPPELRRSGITLSAEVLTRMELIHARGMQADEVGLLTVEAIRSNRFYVFTHPEFKEEVRELSDEALAAFPEGSAPPERDAVEQARRGAIAAAREQIRLNSTP